MRLEINVYLEFCCDRSYKGEVKNERDEGYGGRWVGVGFVDDEELVW